VYLITYIKLNNTQSDADCFEFFLFIADDLLHSNAKLSVLLKQFNDYLSTIDITK